MSFVTPPPIITTKGDILTHDGTNRVRLAVGTNDQVLTADSAQANGIKWAAAGGAGAVTRVGGQTTEATTTSLSFVDLLSATITSTAAATPLLAIYNVRKTSGAAVAAFLGAKLNATNYLGGVAITTTNNRVEIGYAKIWTGPRVTGYVDAGMGPTLIRVQTYANGLTGATYNNWDHANAPPTANITDWVSRGYVDSTSITLGNDDLHVYTYATS